MPRSVDTVRVRGKMTDSVHDRLIVEHLRAHMPPPLVLAIQQAYESQTRAKKELLEVMVASFSGSLGDPARQHLAQIGTEIS